MDRNNVAQLLYVVDPKKPWMTKSKIQGVIDLFGTIKVGESHLLVSISLTSYPRFHLCRIVTLKLMVREQLERR